MKIRIIARTLLCYLLIILTFLPFYGKIERKESDLSYGFSAATAEEKVILPLANTHNEKIVIGFINKFENSQIKKEKDELARQEKEHELLLAVRAQQRIEEEKARKAAEKKQKEEEERKKKEKEERAAAEAARKKEAEIKEKVEAASTSKSSYEPAGGSFKSYTNYQLLSKSSPQWTKIQCNPNAYSDENGLRKVDSYYCVAMGSYYTKTLGDLFEIQTESGTFQVIICDWKDDGDTDSTHRYTTANGCMIEFYVDMTCFNSTARKMGDVSYASSIFQGKVLRVTKIGNYFS